MIEYKYQKAKGLSEKKFLENGHTMFEEDVLQRLKRLAYLEEQIKQGQLLPIDSVSDCSEIYCMYDRRDAEIFCAFDDKERADLEHEECGAPYQIVKLHHGKRK